MSPRRLGYWAYHHGDTYRELCCSGIEAQGGISNLFDAHLDWSQREIDEADCVLLGTYASRRQIVCYCVLVLGTSASLGEIRSAMVHMMSVSLSRVKCCRGPMVRTLVLLLFVMGQPSHCPWRSLWSREVGLRARLPGSGWVGSMPNYLGRLL